MLQSDQYCGLCLYYQKERKFAKKLQKGEKKKLPESDASRKMPNAANIHKMH